MEISREEASQSLEAVRATRELTRVTAATVGSPLLILWGVIWIIGFSLTQFSPHNAGIGWLVLDVAGSLLSWRIGVRVSAIKSSNDWRVVLFFLLLMGFGGVWAFLLAPFNTAHFGGYIVSLIMFAYMAGGLWFGRFYIILGLVVTLLVIAGVLYAGRFENLWLGCAGGGSLILSGLYIGSKGRRARA